MKNNVKHFAGILAIATGLSISAAPLYQDHEPDYSKNKTYQQGMREGKDDKARNKDHSKKHNFKKDEDKKAYEAGYQQGRSH